MPEPGPRDPAALSARLALLHVRGLGPVRTRVLLRRFGSAAAVLAAGPLGWRAAGCSEPLVAALGAQDPTAADADLRWLSASADHHLLFDDDPGWPPQLAGLHGAPLALFVRGSPALLAEPQLAIVGARAASRQGQIDAGTFATAAARAGLVVTSGLALGIDAAAHAAALAAGAPTIAVCGSGPDRLYPPRNRALAEAIIATGALVSEYPPGTAPRPEHFPQRNRIISGLSLGVLVIEAQRGSGSLITAKLAAEQGREVFALPGSIHNPMAQGCHALIRDGALLTETFDDILAALAPQLRTALVTRPVATDPQAGVSPAAPPLAATENRVLAALGPAPEAVDALAARCGLDIAALGAALLGLELAGLAEAHPGDRWARLHRPG